VSFARRRIQSPALLIWLLLLSTGAYAYAQLGGISTTSPASSIAGTSGYSVSNIVYTLSNTNPASVASVRFAIIPSLASARITTVRAKLVSSSSSYFACTNVPAGSQSWSCPMSGVAVASADQLMLDVGQRPDGPGIVLRLPVIRR
jgi:hypothetical protein